jgi:prepilin-type N-terminal cleavage/methylation domain-containing protein
MPQTSPSRGARAKAGYSLIEILFVMAIIAVTAAISLPRAAGALDQVISHTVFFDFQRQVSDLRARAFREEQTFDLVNGADAPLSAADASGQVRTVIVKLRAGWTYKLTTPLMIGAGGACGVADAELLNGERRIMHLESRGHDCRFIRTL